MTVSPSDPMRHGRDRPNRVTGTFVRAGGVRWHLLRSGSGPTILLLHGSASSAHQWNRVAPLLTSDFSLVIPDLPGHGDTSPLPRHGPALQALGRALAEVLEQEGIRPMLAAGHSAGAALALHLAGYHLADLRAVLAVTPALGGREEYLPPFLGEGIARAVRGRLQARVAAGLVRRFPIVEALLRSTGSRISPGDAEHYRELLADPSRMAGVLEFFSRWDAAGVTAEAARLPIRLHWLLAEDDRWTPPARTLRTLRAHGADRGPLRRLAVLPDRGHLLPEEDPAAIAEALRELALLTGTQ